MATAYIYTLILYYLVWRFNARTGQTSIETINEIRLKYILVQHKGISLGTEYLRNLIILIKESNHPQSKRDRIILHASKVSAFRDKLLMMASLDDDDIRRFRGVANEKNGLITILLSQAVEILRDLCNGIEGDNRGYKVTDPDTFMNLIKKSMALVDYVDLFVLESESDKVVQVQFLGDYNCTNLKRYYGHLCYATGILNTIVTECRWKTIPAKITKKNEVNSLVIAREETEVLAYYSDESIKLLHRHAEGERKKRKMMDDVSGENATEHIHDQALLDFLFEKLKKGDEPCNNTDDVMEAIQQLLLEEEIPSHLIPQPEKRTSLFMEKQGLYPSWVEEISPTVFRLLTAGLKSDENK